MINATVDDEDDHPEKALATLDEAFELADAHGLTEHQGWIEYSRMEALTVQGDVEAAIAAAERALAIAGRINHRRIAVRTFHGLVPLTVRRGDPAPALRLQELYGSWEGPYPDSGYARLMRAAMNAWIAEARAEPLPSVPVEPSRAALSQGVEGATIIMAVQKLMDGWLAAADLDAADAALAALREAQATPISGLARAAIDLMGARVALAHGKNDAAWAGAQAALDVFRSIPAPLWIRDAEEFLATLN